MKKIKAQYQSVNSPEIGNYTLIMVPDLKDSDIASNPDIRESFNENFGSNWVVVWDSSVGLPTYVTNGNTQDIAQTEVEKHMDGQWKTKEIQY